MMKVWTVTTETEDKGGFYDYSVKVCSCKEVALEWFKKYKKQINERAKDEYRNSDVFVDEEPDEWYLARPYYQIGNEHSVVFIEEQEIVDEFPE